MPTATRSRPVSRSRRRAERNVGRGALPTLSSEADIASQQFVRQKLSRLASSRARKLRLTRAIDRLRETIDTAPQSTGMRRELILRKITATRLRRMEARLPSCEGESREFRHEKRLEGYVVAASNAVSSTVGFSPSSFVRTDDNTDNRIHAREIVEDMCAHVSGNTQPVCRRYDEEICEACGARKFLIPHEAALICPRCTRPSRLVHPTAAGVVHTLDDDVDANTSAHSSAIRNPHLLRQLAFYLLAQRKGVPVEICERIEAWIIKNTSVRKCADGKREHIMSAIRALKLKKYESYCSTIYTMIFGRAPLLLTPAERVKFYCAFRTAQEHGAPRAYRMCIGLLFELMGLDESADDFLQTTMVDRSESTSGSKRHGATPAFIAQCKQWEGACLAIGWPVSRRVSEPLRRERERVASWQVRASPPTPVLTPTPPAVQAELPPQASAVEATDAFFAKMAWVSPPPVSLPSPPVPVPVPVPTKPVPVPPQPHVRTGASRSIRYKLVLECDRNDFLARGRMHYVPAPASWDEVRHYILTRGELRAPPGRHGKCDTHLVAWHHRDWKVGMKVRDMEPYWLADADVLKSDDQMVVARLSCSAGYHLRDPAVCTTRLLATMERESDRIDAVVDDAAMSIRTVEPNPADPRNHWCEGPATAAERKKLMPTVLKVPHGIPLASLRLVRDGETPMYSKEGRHYVLR